MTEILQLIRLHIKQLIVVTKDIIASFHLSLSPGYLVDVNAAANNGDSALHIASRLGYADLVDTLLENGASVRNTL